MKSTFFAVKDINIFQKTIDSIENLEMTHIVGGGGGGGGGEKGIMLIASL